MSTRGGIRIARWIWIAPVFLFVMAVYQGKTWFDFARTMNHGQSVQADVIDAGVKAMQAQAHGYVTIRASTDQGIIEKTMALPVSLAQIMRATAAVEVRILPGSGQEVVIVEIAASQMRVAAFNSLIAGVGGIISAAALLLWMRFLKRRGDPSEWTVEENEAYYPVGSSG